MRGGQVYFTGSLKFAIAGLVVLEVLAVIAGVHFTVKYW